MKTKSRTINGKKVEFVIEFGKKVNHTNDFSKSGSKSGQLICETDVTVTIDGVQYNGKLKSHFTNKIDKWSKMRSSKETFVFDGKVYEYNEKQLITGLTK